jgi:Domain of unknown function (DUF6875)
VGNKLDVEATQAEAAFWQWVEEYVCRPHPEIGREGAVCPFLPNVVQADGLHVEIDDTLDGSDPAAMEARVRAAVPVFEAIPLAPWKKALALLFPKVVGADVTVVDRVQAAVKPDCVRRGLMVGQFHPLSTEPGARNPAFPANRAPFAAIALRHMSYHDIVFLDRDPEMFREYQDRYGDDFSGGRDLDPFLVDRYEAAAARFGAPDAA